MATSKKELAKSEAQLPSYYDYGNLSGAGAEDITADDTLLPFVRIAQPLSPELEKKEEKYIPGLEAGQYFNTSTQRKYGRSDEEGCPWVVHVCVKERAFAEFVPRNDGGGFVGQRVETDPLVMDLRAKFGKFGKLINEEDNTEIIETYYLFGIVPPDENNPDPEAIVLPFASTGITPVKQYLMRMKPLLQRSIPIYAPRVRIVTHYTQNKKGKFYKPELRFDGDAPRDYLLSPDDPLMKVCDELRISVKAGQVKADYANVRNVTDEGEEEREAF